MEIEEVEKFFDEEDFIKMSPNDLEDAGFEENVLDDCEIYYLQSYSDSDIKEGLEIIDKLCFNDSSIIFESVELIGLNEEFIAIEQLDSEYTDFFHLIGRVKLEKIENIQYKLVEEDE